MGSFSFICRSASVRRVAASAVWVLAVGLAGCQGPGWKGTSEGPGPGRITHHDDVAYVAIFAKTPLLDLDHDKRPEGVAVRTYLYRQASKDPVAARGPITFRLIKRTKSPEGAPSDEELKRWELSEEQLAGSLGRDQFGFLCYQMSLYWKGVKVAGPGIYLQAEFVRQDQSHIPSRLLLLPILARGDAQRG